MMVIFFFKQKTAYDIGLGIPAEPLFRSRRLHARIRKTRYMHKMRCLLINRRSLLLALRLLWKTPIFPSNSRFPRLCYNVLPQLDINNTIDHRPEGDEKWFLENEKTEIGR